MIDGLLKIAEILFGRADKLREADLARRKRLSVYFENVSRCLLETADALKKGTEPRFLCEELIKYNQMGSPIHDTDGLVAKVFGENLAVEVQRELFEVIDVPFGAVFSLSEISRRDLIHVPHLRPEDQRVLAESIAKIEKSAGTFRALSVLALTSP